MIASNARDTHVTMYCRLRADSTATTIGKGERCSLLIHALQSAGDDEITITKACHEHSCSSELRKERVAQAIEYTKGRIKKIEEETTPVRAKKQDEYVVWDESDDYDEEKCKEGDEEWDEEEEEEEEESTTSKPSRRSHQKSKAKTKPDFWPHVRKLKDEISVLLQVSCLSSP
jgi:hypothetical protein